MWSPFSRPDPVRVPLECSGGEAAIVLRKWGAGERLAYEDGASRFVKRDDAGKVSEVAAGSLKLFGVSLICVGADGFGTLPGGEAFDPRRADHLRELDSEVYDEIARHAFEVQPLPGSEPKGDEPEGDEAPADNPDAGTELRERFDRAGVAPLPDESDPSPAP